MLYENNQFTVFVIFKINSIVMVEYFSGDIKAFEPLVAVYQHTTKYTTATFAKESIKTHTHTHILHKLYVSCSLVADIISYTSP